ncbi:MAG: DUF3593 domain-containing protein [Synechococcales cyanobacterium]
MSTLFALSLLPYLVFLFFLWRIPSAPLGVKQGFTFLLVFVAITIPAGIYAQNVLHTSLANVDGLHGGAEVFLTLTNIWILIGFKQGIDRARRDPGNDSV